MKNWQKLGLALTLSSALLSACSPEAVNNSSGGGSGEILIGVQTPTTGSSAKMGEDMNNAIKMATEEINEKGGIDGKKIKLEFADDACDPQTATAAANKLVSQGVKAVIGFYCSGATLPSSGIYHNAGVPVMVTAASSAKIPAQGYKEVFLTTATTDQQSEAAAEYMLKKLGGKRIAIVHDNTAFAKGLAETTQTAVQKQGGQVVAFEAINPEEKDFTAMLTQLKAQKPDATFWTAYYAAGGLLIKQFEQLGVSGAIGVGDGSNDKTLIEIAGKEAAEDAFVITTPTAEFIPEAKSFIDTYKSKYNMEPGPYTAVSYDGMRLLADAIKRAGSDDKAAIVKALSETKSFKTFGGDVSFKSDGTLEKSNFIVLKVKNGQFTRE